MSRKIILIKQELLLLVYELNRSGLLAENEKDRKSGSAGMPRPISYAVFCLKKKKIPTTHAEEHILTPITQFTWAMDLQAIDFRSSIHFANSEGAGMKLF